MAFITILLFLLYQGETTKDLSIAVQMMKRIYSVMEKYAELLQEADRQLIARCLSYLGFEELASSLRPTQVMFSEQLHSNRVIIRCTSTVL